MQAARWPSADPAPQLFMGPQVDRILERGVGHWVSYRERHGFTGPHITCAARPLHNQGLRALANEMPYTWVWPWGDRQRGQTPDGTIVGDDARRYYDTLHTLVGHLGPDRIGFGLGFDLHEWVGDGDHARAFDLIAQWVELMGERFPGHMVGGRALVEAGAWPGTYAGFEHRVEHKGDFRAMLEAAIAAVSPMRPILTEDRFRARGGTRPKDWSQAQMLAVGMPLCLELVIAAIWGVLDPDDQDGGALDFDDPAAVHELLRGGEPPPPPGPTCRTAAEYAAALNALAERMQREVVEPIENDLEQSRYKRVLVGLLGYEGYIDTATEILALGEVVIEEMETCVPADGGEEPPPPPPPDNPLEGARNIGVIPEWQPHRYELEGSINTVELDDELKARWAPPSTALYPDADFGPFDPGDHHFGRLYLALEHDGELVYWGVEWLRRPVETNGTTVGPWVDEGLDILGTLIAKSGGDIPSDWRPAPGSEFMVFYASPVTRRRSHIVRGRFPG